jgi:hypothetical protein
MSKGCRIIPNVWYKDTKDRIWVVLNVLPFFPTEDSTEVVLLEFGKMESINRPYSEIQELVESGTFTQIPFNAKLKIQYI